jgi:hypothetical protein
MVRGLKCVVVSLILASFAGCGQSAPSKTAASSPSPRLPSTAQVASAVSTDQAVTATLDVVPTKLAAGATATLKLSLQIRADWHIQALGAASGPSQPTELSIELPNGIEAMGEWDVPDIESIHSSRGIQHGYAGEVVFTRELSVKAAAMAGPAKIGVRLRYQACNETLCDQPIGQTLTTPVEIVGN